VLQIYVSETYDPQKQFQGDVAVLHLENPISYSEEILPVCLPTDVTRNVNALKAGSVGNVMLPIHKVPH